MHVGYRDVLWKIRPIGEVHGKENTTLEYVIYLYTILPRRLDPEQTIDDV